MPIFFGSSCQVRTGALLRCEAEALELLVFQQHLPLMAAAQALERPFVDKRQLLTLGDAMLDLLDRKVCACVVIAHSERPLHYAWAQVLSSWRRGVRRARAVARELVADEEITLAAGAALKRLTGSAEELLERHEMLAVAEAGRSRVHSLSVVSVATDVTSLFDLASESAASFVVDGERRAEVADAAGGAPQGSAAERERAAMDAALGGVDPVLMAAFVVYEETHDRAELVDTL